MEACSTFLKGRKLYYAPGIVHSSRVYSIRIVVWNPRTTTKDALKIQNKSSNIKMFPRFFETQILFHKI